MIVVDASVVIKWINQDEQDSDLARRLLHRHLEKLEEIIVPRLLFYEVANTLATKSRTSKETMTKGLHLLLGSSLRIYLEQNKELIEASILAKDYHASVYDMLYALIAKKKKTRLITADKKFLEKTKFKFVKLLR